MSPSSARPSTAPPRWRRIADNALVAMLYYASGTLALQLGHPQGYAASVWPASGIVLATVLLVGSRVWPGIALGAIAVSLERMLGSGDPTSILSAGVISVALGAGAAFQALVGGFSVRRMAGFPNTLSNEGDVLRFLLFGGPVSCVIRPSIGVASLALLGKISPEEILSTWGTWWVGETIGTVLFAPVVLLWCAGPLSVRLRRKISVTIPLALTFGLTLFLFEQVSARDLDRAERDFERRCGELGHRFQRGFDESLGLLESLGGFFDAAHWIDRSQFVTFARNSLQRSRAVLAIGWIPRIRDSDRFDCVRAGRREVDPDFQILEHDADGAWASAARREEYAPAFYLAPPASPIWRLGFDAASDPLQREAILRARDEGEPAATRPIRLGTEGEGELAFCVFHPVYGTGEDRSTIEGRRTSLTGYAAAILVVDRLMDEGLAGVEDDDLRVELWDVSDGAPGRVLHERGPEDDASARLTVAGNGNRPHVAACSIAGRAWELRFLPHGDVLVGRRSWQAWCVLTVGLLFTGLLGAFLLVVTGRADAIEGLVTKRTAEIARMNSDLRHQVAERSRAEAEHQQSEARLAAAQQIAHLGSWELDLGTNVFLWSDELYRIHGLAPREVRIDFEQFMRRVHPRDQQYVDLILEQAARDHRPFRFRYRIVRPDGTVRTLNGRGEVAVDDSHKPIRMHGTGQDVTELEQAERELADRTAELERSNAEMERFAYVASHDLQEPLRAVASHVQILQQDYQGRLDSEADECIRCAVEGARRMHDLINDYLAYSRVRTGADPRLPMSATDALESALRELGDSIAESRARITHGPLPVVVADPEQLVELFRNLIANAVKFRGTEPPRVHVTASRADKAWVFSVRDNGIGIDPEQTGRIFRLFQRLHTQDRYPGTGIGLAICKKIVDHHGGRIWVESMPGLGSTFHFTLSTDADETSARVPNGKGGAAPGVEIEAGGTG